MSLLGAIVEHYDNGVSNDLTALRAALGDDQMYADVMPGNPGMPYCVLAELQTELFGESKAASNRPRIQDTTVAFAVFATNRAQAETILEALEEAYLDSLDAHLTLPEGQQHMATYFGNRLSYYDNTCGMWRGQLELRFKFSKHRP